MKKRLLLSSLFISGTLLFTACSSKEEYKPNSVEGECIISGENAPKWACGSYEEKDRYIATGSAPKSKLGFDFTRKEALLNARTNLVNQIKIDIKTKAESYMRSTGLEDKELVEKVVTVVSKQATEMTLNESKQISYWENKSANTIHLLIAVNKDEINKTITKNIEEYIDNPIQLQNSEDALNKLN